MRDLLRQARRAPAARRITPRAKRADTRDDVLGPMLDALPEDTRGVRDRALLAVAFASGGRRRAAPLAPAARRPEHHRRSAVPVPAAYAAHSLRSGFLTTGGRDGIPLDLLMQLSGHKSHRIAARYFQTGAVHQNPAADLL
ncbi:hypothetical protein HUE56_07320 (plasmid) [Azospirillum oryzae]|uniref:Phage integrase family protein n=1 Tax=Azospirillum oryzae TaxID=286727 RepID=A0A6N1AFP1_9PROT|nr:hypothetical protein [Azospirillum oryzae]KAA0587261.1 hypothetical protein FZ938_17445 [Azospirillum oryzae]QKS50356.1 hypothetical protein HUE56_07320 [Azospirillum oryzae]GLR80983.1 hypothetical protein GCM10007856_36640 [Azospirillum oryzae]